MVCVVALDEALEPGEMMAMIAFCFECMGKGQLTLAAVRKPEGGVQMVPQVGPVAEG